MLSYQQLFILPNQSNKKFLVLDLDGTTISARKQDSAFLSKACPHLLSPEVLSRARNNQYEGIIICTHRCLQNDKHNIEKVWSNIEDVRNYVIDFQSRAEATNEPLEQYTKTWKSYEEFTTFPDMTALREEDTFVSCIIKNLEQATSLKCLVVSTPDDAYGTCGSGYQNILKPFEEAALQTMKVVYFNNKHSKTFCLFPDSTRFSQNSVAFYDVSTKNPQLIQIAQWVTEHYPDNIQITLDFIDDNETVINSAIKLDSEKLLHNITLNIHYHSAFDATPIDLRGTIQGTYQGDAKNIKPGYETYCFFASPQNNSMVNNIESCNPQNNDTLIDKNFVV